jgi:hypothetical protein
LKKKTIPYPLPMMVLFLKSLAQILHSHSQVVACWVTRWIWHPIFGRKILYWNNGRCTIFNLFAYKQVQNHDWDVELLIELV